VEKGLAFFCFGPKWAQPPQDAVQLTIMPVTDDDDDDDDDDMDVDGAAKTKTSDAATLAAGGVSAAAA
jgi:hypothetical protein